MLSIWQVEMNQYDQLFGSSITFGHAQSVDGDWSTITTGIIYAFDGTFSVVSITFWIEVQA